ncbi:MAG: hypothetical protein DI576_06315 [Actinomyces sp.]|nr:MAG: hypothetical protein DI576_06315 [Actinomyces sp.]
MNGLPAWSAVYTAFDDATLAALANRGLVRRGRAELAARRVEARNIGQDAATVAVTPAAGRPAIPVVLGAGGPAEARCPCPVAGVCVHVVAACLWMREAAAAAGTGAEAPAPDAAGPGDDDPGAAAAARAGAGAEEPAGPAAPATSSGHAARPEAPLEPHPGVAGEDDQVLAEVLAWEPAVVEKTLGVAALRRVAAADAGADPARLAADTRLSRAPGRLSVTWPGAPEVVVIAGLGPGGMVVAGRHAQVAHAAWRLRAVVRLFATAGRAWPWDVRENPLSAGQRRLLASTTAAVESVIAAGISHAGPRSAHELDRLAQAARLEEAPRLARLLSSAAGAVDAVARRDDGMDEAAALSALAAAWSLTRALEAAGAAPDPALLGRADTEQTQPGLLVPLSATWWLAPSGSRGLTARFWDLDNHRLETVTTGRAAGADPAFQRSEDAPLVWGASVRTLLSGPLRLAGATRRGDGALAPSRRTTVTRCGGYDGIDLAALAHELGSLRRGPRAAGFEAPAPPVRLLLPGASGLGRFDLDEVHQQYVWLVHDEAGQDHLLRLDPDGAESRLVAAVLARNLPVVAITLELAERLERLRAEAAVLAPPREAGPIEALCADVHEALTALAASGALRAEGMTAYVLATRARAARDLQLQTLAAALAEVEERPGPRAVLRACAVVDRVRALAR